MGFGPAPRPYGTQTGRPIRISADGFPEYKAGGVTIDWGAVAAVAGSDYKIPIEETTVPVGKKYLRYGQVLVRNQTREVQTVSFTGTVTGGTFTLTLTRNAQTLTTAGIAYNAPAGDVQAALEALGNLAPGNVTVTGGPGPGTPYTVTFNLAENVAQMTASGAALTGTTPGVTVATTTEGTASYGMFFPATNTSTLTRGHTVVLNETVLEDQNMSNYAGGMIIGGKVFQDRLLVGGAGQPTLAALLDACPRLEPVPD